MPDRRVLAVATGNAHKAEEIAAVLGAVGIEVITAVRAGAPADFDPEETGLTFEDNSLIKAKALAEILFGTDGTSAGGGDKDASDEGTEIRGKDIIGVVADDSGLCVDALGGAPGVFSARYAGTGSDADNTAKLLTEISDVRDEKRTAQFVCVITYISRSGDVTVCRGECAGHIIREPRGDGGFGYDPVFVPGDSEGTGIADSLPAGFTASHQIDAAIEGEPLSYAAGKDIHCEYAGMTFAEMSPGEKNRISHRAAALAKLRDALSE